MDGEQLDHARIGSLGIGGDRVVHVENEDGHVITSRTHPRLLGHHARLNESGDPVAKLVRDESIDRLDVLPFLVATDGAIAAFGHDGRRFGPNLVIGGVEELAERDWPGQCLHTGDVVIGIQDLRWRCIMTTFDPDTLKQDLQVLRDIARKFDGTLPSNCYVIQGGQIRVGDPVELVPEHECWASRV